MPQSVLLALAFNLLPVVCAPLFGWSLLSLMLLYWAENIIVGIINVAKMIICGVGNGPKGLFSLLFYVPFFVIHYGLFCAVHGVLILVLFNGEPSQSVDDPLQLPGIFLHQIHIDTFLALNLALLTVFHLYRFAVDWLGTGQWRTTIPVVQMFMPYGRIMVVHVAVLLGGFLASFIGSPLIAVLLLAFLKTALEVGVAEAAESSTTAAASGGPQRAE